METRANYVAIGLFVVLVLIGALGALYWLYAKSQAGATQVVRIVFPEPVTGLSVGGSVLFNGIRVGEVTQLRFVQQGGDDVIAFVRINADTPVKTDTTAKLGFQGLTGVAYISMTGGSQNAKSLFAEANGQIPTIRAETSAFTNVLDSAQSVLSRVNSTLDEVNSFLKDNRGNLDTVVKNVTDMTTTLNEAAPQVRGMIDDVASASRGIAEAVPRVTSTLEHADRLITAVDPDAVSSVVTNVERFAGDLPALGSDAREVMQKANGLVTRLDDAAATLGEAVQAVNNVVEAIDADAVGAIVENVRVASGVIAERAGTIASTLDNAQAIAADVRQVTDGIASQREGIVRAVENAQLLIAEAREAVGVAAPAVARFSEAMNALTPERVEVIVESVERITSGVAEQLPQVDRFIASASEAAGNISRVAELLAARSETINAALSDAADILKNVKAASTDAPAIMASVRERLDEAGGILQAIDTEALGNVIDNVDAFSKTLADQREPIAELIANASGAAKQVETLSATLGESAPQIKQVIDRADTAMASVETFAKELPGLIDALKPGVENVTAVLSAVDPDAVRGLVESASSFAATLAAQSDNIGKLLTSATGAAERIDSIASALAVRTPQLGDIIDDVEAAVKSAEAFAGKLPELAQKLEPGVENASAALAAIDPEAIGALVDNASQFVEGLAAQREAIASLIANADETAKNAATVSRELAARSSDLGAIVDNARVASESAVGALGDARAAIADLRPAAAQLAAAIEVVTPARVDDVLTQVQLILGGLSDQRENVEVIIADVRATAEAARDISTKLAARAPELERILDDAATAADNVREASEGLPGLVSSIEPGLRNAGDTLAALDPEAITAIQRDAVQFADMLASQRQSIEQLLQSTSGAAARIEAIASAVAQRMPQIGAIIDSTEGAVASARRFADALPGFAETLQPGLENVSDVLTSIDPEAISQIVTDAQTFADTLAAESGTIRSLLTEADNAARQATGLISAVSERTPQITSAIDSASRAIASAETFANTLPEMSERLQPGIDNLSDVLSAIDPEAISEVVENARSLANTLAEQGPAVTRIVGNLDKASTDAASVAQRLNGQMDGIAQALDDARVGLADARRFAAGLPGLLDDLQPGVENLSTVLSTIDPEAIEDIVNNVRSLSDTLANSQDDIQSLLATAGNAARQVERVTQAVSERADVITGIIENASRFAASLGEASPRIDDLVASAQNAMDAVSRTVSAVNATAINDVIENAQKVAQAVGSRAGEIGRAIDEAAGAAKGLSEGLGTLGGSDGTLKQILDQAKRIGANLENASARVNLVVERAEELLDGPAQRLVANVSTAAADVADVAGAFASRANAIAGGLARFSQGGLDDLRAVLNQGRSTLASIETAVMSFDRNPSRVIFGGPNGPRYTPQRR